MWLFGCAAGYCAARARAAHLADKKKANIELLSKPIRIACVCGHCHDTEKCEKCFCTKHIVLDWEKQQ